MSRARIFHDGTSQAVRLPKSVRIESKTVEIFRRGDEVILREMPRTLGDTVKHLAILGEDFPTDIADPAPEPLPAWDATK